MDHFPEKQPGMKKDRYSRARDGASRILQLTCSVCEAPFALYQKDGPGRLLRLYADRIYWPEELVERLADIDADNVKEIGVLACGECDEALASPMVYKSENRPAFRVQPGSIASSRMQ